jgi:DNA (cytosine-5)-methyltransferase 1
MGARQGVRDARGRGLIINHIISALAAKRPRAFLLENVKGLVTQHRATFEDILQQLRHMAGSAYKVGFKIIDTADLGIPQHRERVYIVGLLRAAMVPGFSFTWPTPRERKSLPRALGWRKKPDKRKARKREKRFLANATPKLRQRLKKALQDIRRKGVDPRDIDQPVVVDIDGSKPHWMHGISPCLTQARASTGHYLPVLGRRLTIPERLRLQALPVDIHARCEGNVSDRQLGAMIGNSLSLNVVGALVSQMLVACGLAAECQWRPA